MFNGETSSSSARNVIRSSSISGEMYNIEKSNGGNPDSASLSSNKKRRSSLGAKMVAIVGLSQWSKSTMQLNHPGKKTFWFREVKAGRLILGDVLMPFGRCFVIVCCMAQGGQRKRPWQSVPRYLTGYLNLQRCSSFNL